VCDLQFLRKSIKFDLYLMESMPSGYCIKRLRIKVNFDKNLLVQNTNTKFCLNPLCSLVQKTCGDATTPVRVQFV
jgi:hypothetical protein